MADYYPLIARAVEGLPDNRRDMRRAVYERARTALIAQLRTLDPPLSEAEIEQEAPLPRRGHHPRRGGLRGGAAGPMRVMSRPPMPAITWQPEDRAPRHRLTACAPRRRRRQPRRSAEDAAAYAEPAVARPKVDSRPHPAMQSKRRGRGRSCFGVGPRAGDRRHRRLRLPVARQARGSGAGNARRRRRRRRRPSIRKINERVGGGQARAGAGSDSRSPVRRSASRSGPSSTRRTPPIRRRRRPRSDAWSGASKTSIAGQGQPLETAVAATSRSRMRG